MRAPHSRLAWMVTNLWLLGICHRLSQPAIIRGVPPHWVNEPHQELAPALMVVAGSFLPPFHQGLLLPRSLLLTSSLCREFGGSSFSAISILPFSFSSLGGRLVRLVHHLHPLLLLVQLLVQVPVLGLRCRSLGPSSPLAELAVYALLLS